MTAQKTYPSRRPIMGIIAMILGSLAILGSILGPEVVQIINPPPPTEERIANFALRLKESLKDSLKQTEENTRPKAHAPNGKSMVMTISIGLGVLSLISTATAFVRREPRRFAIAAGGLAILALAWQAVLIGIGALAVMALLAFVFSWLN
jgi:hypothetical protein